MKDFTGEAEEDYSPTENSSRCTRQPTGIKQTGSNIGFGRMGNSKPLQWLQHIIRGSNEQHHSKPLVRHLVY